MLKVRESVLSKTIMDIALLFENLQGVVMMTMVLLRLNTTKQDGPEDEWLLQKDLSMKQKRHIYTDDLNCAVDILHEDRDTYEIIEVKCSNKAREIGKRL